MADDSYRNLGDWYGPAPRDLFAAFPGIERWEREHTNLDHPGAPEECQACQESIGRLGPMPPRWALKQIDYALWKLRNPDQYAARLRESKAARENRRHRAALLERDGHKCRTCDATEDLTVDHVTPISLGGTDDFGNLQILCKSCNTRKGNRLPPFQLTLFTTGKTAIEKMARVSA